MSRNKELAKNTAILTIGKVCTQFISFFLLPLYTKILSPEEYGIVDLFTTYITLLLPLVCWQFDQGIFRFMIDARGDEKKTKILFTSVTVVNVLQCCVLIVLYVAIHRFIDSEYKIYLIISVILNVFSGLLMQFARGLGKMLQYSIGSFVTATSTVVLNVIFIVFFRWGAHGMFLAMVVGILLNCLYLAVVLKVWKYFDIKYYNSYIIKEVCKYSLPLVPNQISGWVLSASNRTIITHVVGLAANGVFSVANKFSNLVGTFYGFFNLAWVETVSLHYNDEDRDEFISDMMEKTLQIFICVCIGMMAFMPFVFPVMIDIKYVEAYYQIPILLLSVIFQIVVGLYSAIYIALKKSITIARTTIVGAIINVGVHVLLINIIGVYAASISTFVAFAAVALYRRFDVKKYINISFSKGFFTYNCVATLFTILSYYINNVLLNIITFVVVIIFSIMINRDMLQSLLNEILKLLQKNRKGNV